MNKTIPASLGLDSSKKSNKTENLYRSKSTITSHKFFFRFLSAQKGGKDIIYPKAFNANNIECRKNYTLVYVIKSCQGGNVESDVKSFGLNLTRTFPSEENRCNAPVANSY